MIIEISEENNPQLKELEKKFPQLLVDFSVQGKNLFTKIYAILENNEPVGCIILDTIYERMELIQIEVVEAKRKQGYGAKLIEFMLERAKAENCQNITLEVREDNMPAIKLYEKYGFQKVAMRKNYYHGKDGILMERKMM